MRNRRPVGGGVVGRVAVAVVLWLWAAVAAAALAGAPPNIILILTDDQGWSQTSGLMDPRIDASRSGYLETPNMDRLARQGMRFTSGYSPAPLCTPTRRSILCGTSTARSGSEFKSTWVPADHLTIPRALKRANPSYRCAHFGKWGEQMISTPEQCGYDISDGETGNKTGGMPSSLGVASGKHGDGPPHFIDDDDPKRTRTVTDRAIDFMQTEVRGGHPFYVQISYYAVHLSVVCRTETLAKYRRKGPPDRGYTQAWAAMMEELDTGIGRLLAAVDDLGVRSNTYVFFTSDNGGRGRIPGGTDSPPPNLPLTGAKHSLYEGGVRVPFVVRGPGIAAGSVCHTPVIGYDFLPTFFDLGGGTQALDDGIDGGSIRPLFTAPQTATVERPVNALIFHRPGRLFSAIRRGTDKLMLFWKPAGSIDHRELYKVDPDPREGGRELAAGDSAKADELQQLLTSYLKQVDAETPLQVKRKGKGGRQRLRR